MERLQNITALKNEQRNMHVACVSKRKWFLFFIFSLWTTHQPEH